MISKMLPIAQIIAFASLALSSAAGATPLPEERKESLFKRLADWQLREAVWRDSRRRQPYRKCAENKI